MIAWTVLACAGVSNLGCRRQAYNELYIEQMASEIRALEDRIYEFDAEYRALEDELLIAQQELELARDSTRSGSSSRKLFGNGLNSKNPPSNQSGIDIDEMSPPSVDLPNKTNGNGSGGSIPSPGAPSGNPTKQPDRSLLTPPSVGAQPTPSDGQLSNVMPSPSDPDSVRASQIPLPNFGPVQTAVHTESGARRSSKPDSELDRRVVEIAFYAPLCRGKNFDESNEDDGIYLVLQPKNRVGEVVPEIGNLTIIAADPAIEDGESRFASWSISAAQASEAMQRTGASQGIHLALPFQDARPSGDRVVVYVRMELPNGRRVINDHSILVRNRSDRSLWLPRTSISTPQE